VADIVLAVWVPKPLSKRAGGCQLRKTLSHGTLAWNVRAMIDGQEVMQQRWRLSHRDGSYPDGYGGTAVAGGNGRYGAIRDRTLTCDMRMLRHLRAETEIRLYLPAAI